ncbi:AbrB/MazE/SpoVT family DNA-binding domain-containing protein [Candidatus Gracilibacteria bacterium]|nr:AbrB/MazE/SpoVT family DNA-binding domain-containing protein [Candidatus Gracilibacteria bacterium]
MSCDKKLQIQLCGTANIGSKGQIVIPKQAREVLGLQPGDSVSIVIKDNNAICIIPNESIENLLKYIQEDENMELITTQ